MTVLQSFDYLMPEPKCCSPKKTVPLLMFEVTQLFHLSFANSCSVSESDEDSALNSTLYRNGIPETNGTCAYTIEGIQCTANTQYIDRQKGNDKDHKMWSFGYDVIIWKSDHEM
eukprot:348706_1